MALLLNVENKIFQDYSSTADLIKLDLNISEVGEPSLNILTLFEQLDLQKERNQNLFIQLQTKAKELYSDLKLVEIDKQQLKNRQSILGLEVKELGTMQLNFSDNSVFETKQIREIFQLKNDAEQNLISLKNEINKFYDSQISKGKFANPLWEKTDRELFEMLDSMSTQEKAGQLFVFAIGGTSINNDLKNELEKNKPSGVIYMGYNISNITQTAKFSNDIQLTNNKIPLFISTDQEGGVVKRISWDNTSGQKDWVNFSDEKICEQSKSRAILLHDIGININYSPVVDLSILGGGFINNRTISNDPEIVIEKAQEYIKCSQEENVSTTLKHFPGHGSTAEDSHFNLPQINKSKEEWLSSDGKPFKELKDSKFIMLGHLLFKQIDSQEPATLSKILITDILKNEFQYKGLIITDDMNMLYTSTKMEPKDMIVKAINAGVDQLLFVGFPKTKDKLIDITSKAIESKEISPERVQESLLKILIAKRDLK